MYFLINVNRNVKRNKLLFKMEDHLFASDTTFIIDINFIEIDETIIHN